MQLSTSTRVDNRLFDCVILTFRLPSPGWDIGTVSKRKGCKTAGSQSTWTMDGVRIVSYKALKETKCRHPTSYTDASPARRKENFHPMINMA